MRIDEEFKKLIPPLSVDEFQQLERNIIADGCRDPLVIWEGVLIDGHNRFDICSKHRIDFRTVNKSFTDRDEATLWIINNQFGRRNISDFVRAELALKAEPLIAARAKENLSAVGGDKKSNEYKESGLANLPEAIQPVNTRDELSKLAGVSSRNISKVKNILESGSEDLVTQVRSGNVSINAAETIAELPVEKQVEIVARGEKEILQAAKEIRAEKAKAKRTERIEKIAEISKGNTGLDSDVRYPVIYADPPWRYEYASTESRAIENQYPTMSIDDICDLNVPAADDAILFMWTTAPKLEEGLRVLNDWGFIYRSCAIWDKQKMGMGYYFRIQHEILLIGTKGNIPAPEPSVRPRSVFSISYDGHSAKPHEVAEMIEAMYPELPKLEMFCRKPRDGWSVWGNQSAA